MRFPIEDHLQTSFAQQQAGEMEDRCEDKGISQIPNNIKINKNKLIKGP